MIDYGENAKAALDRAYELAKRTGGRVCTEHLLFGLLDVCDSVACRILGSCDIYRDDVAGAFEMSARYAAADLSPRADAVIATARCVTAELGGSKTNTEHLLYALMDYPDSMAYRIVAELGVDPEYVQKLAYDAIIEDMNRRRQYGKFGGGQAQNDIYKNGMQPPRIDMYGEDILDAKYISSAPEARSDELSKFGTDLTLRARQGKLDPVIGRDKETERVIQVLCRRTKNNPVLVGEPGVGKSAIVDGLAIAIAEGNVPEPLKDKTVFALDLSSLVAGTRYRGDFEERLNNALNTIKKRGDIILFIDEIHTILKAGSAEGGLDIANILKPMLARGELTTIGATTLEEYRKQFEQDSALERRFQPVRVEEPSVADAIAILRGLRPKYEAHHGVAISDEAVAAAAVLSDRYVSDRFLPDKAVDLMDEAASCKRLAIKDTPTSIKNLQSQLKEANKTLKECQNSGSEAQIDRLKQLVTALLERLADECRTLGNEFTVGEDDIAAVVSEWTGIPVSKMSVSEAQKLSTLAETLKKRVIGQDAACDAVARAVLRARSGIKDPKRPIGSFLFMGPTGVGKTELAKSLAEAMFGDENMLIRVDMSEYMDKGSASRLIGAAPGLVGFEEGGQLTEKVRRKPYSVVLFDEIEKGHEDIYDLLLQVLEDGILTDSKGRTVSFKNAVIILTSNIGAKEAATPMRATGFGAAGADSPEKDKYMQALRGYMKPEIINRLDEIVVFDRLEADSIRKILDIMIASLSKRLDEKGIKLKFTEAAKSFLAEKGFDPAYGARPLRRALSRLVEDKLSELILSGDICDGDVALVDVGGGGREISIEKL